MAHWSYDVDLTVAHAVQRLIDDFTYECETHQDLLSENESLAADLRDLKHLYLDIECKYLRLKIQLDGVAT